MRKRRIAIVATLLAAVAGPASAVNVEPVGPWVIKSGNSGSGGPYCTAELKTEERTLGLQTYTSGRHVFAAINAAWTLTPKQTYPVTFETVGGDGAPARWTGDAIAVLPTTLVLFVRDASDPVAALARAKTMKVEATGSALNFDLSAFPPVEAVLKRCLVDPEHARK